MNPNIKRKKRSEVLHARRNRLWVLRKNLPNIRESKLSHQTTSRRSIKRIKKMGEAKKTQKLPNTLLGQKRRSPVVLSSKIYRIVQFSSRPSRPQKQKPNELEKGVVTKRRKDTRNTRGLRNPAIEKGNLTFRWATKRLTEIIWNFIKVLIIIRTTEAKGKGVGREKRTVIDGLGAVTASGTEGKTECGIVTIMTENMSGIRITGGVEAEIDCEYWLNSYSLSSLKLQNFL